MKITNIKPLYRYENPDHSISITPNKRDDGDVIYAYRLVADEDCELYHNSVNTHTTVLDVKTVDGWTQEFIEDYVTKQYYESGGIDHVSW